MSSPPNDLQSLLAHGSFIRALARSLVRGAARADDLVQETFLAALEHPPRTGEVHRSWLAKRSARAEARRKRREEAASRPEALPSTEEIVARETTRRRMLEAAVAEAETGVPPLEFRASLPSARRTIWGEKTSPGQFRVEAPPGTWTLRVAAEGFVESERPGIEIVSGVSHDPIEVTLDRGARVRGVVRASGGGLEDVVVRFRENDRADGPRARVGKDGTYGATGFRPGRYRVELETYRFRGEPYYAPSQPHELVVGETEQTLVLDLEAVPAGQLWVRVQCGRLAPPEWDNRDTSEEQRQRSEAARLEVRDGQARTLWLWVGLMDGSTYVTNLPAGEYRVHLNIPGAAPVEREVRVEEGKRVDVELEAP